MVKIAGVIYLLLIITVFSSDAAVIFAAMNEVDNADAIISTVVSERQKARQEYEEYKRNKEADVITTQPAGTNVAAKKDDAYSDGGNDMMIGIGLLLVAAVLMIYMRIVTSKKRQER